MQHFYTFVVACITFCTSIATLHAQEEIIYDAQWDTSLLSLGTVISNTSTEFTGDAVTMAGSNRVISQIEIDVFLQDGATPMASELTVALYTDCPIGDGSTCGEPGAGQLIEGSETTISLPPFDDTRRITIPMPLVDVSSETDDRIYVMFNCTIPTVVGVVNGVPVVGGSLIDDIPSTLTRCNAGSDSNCGFMVNGAILNNYSMTVKAVATLGVDMANVSNQVFLFPNPVESQLTVSFLDSVTPQTVSVFDVFGREVAQKYVFNLENNFKMDVAALPVGTYFLQFNTEEGKVVKQFIKTK